MRKLITLYIALQCSVAGLFSNTIIPNESGLTPPLIRERACPELVSGGLGGEATKRSIKVLSWNIQMLPRIAGDKAQELRAKAIGYALKGTDYDVIIFQEAFMKDARNVLWEMLKADYPYQSGEPIKGGLTLFNGGVWIISKLPIKNRFDKLYRECDGIDCFAKKGATMIEVEKDGKLFQIVGTHLQADEGKDKQRARDAQYYELAQLLNAHKTDGVPQIIAGDFNTMYSDSLRYRGMLNVLGAEDGPISGMQQCSWDNLVNDFTFTGKDTCQILLDYVFLRNNGFEFKNESRIIRRMQLQWAAKHSDLSDHFAIEAKFEY